MKHAILAIILAICAQSVSAGTMSCQFNKICYVNESCSRTKYSADFIKHEESDAYAIVADASLEAVGIFATQDGRSGSFVSKSAMAMEPYEDIYVLSYSPGGSVLTIVQTDSDDLAEVVVFTGKCGAEQ